MYSKPLFRRSARRVYPKAAAHYRSDGDLTPTARTAIFVGVGMLILFIICVTVYISKVSSQIAAADARDVITAKVNSAVLQTLTEGDYEGDYFVTFQKSDSGDITAVSCNMARINTLTSTILDKVIGTTRDNSITIGIPVGNLTGASLLMGRGPKLPVKIMVLSSSKVEFSNSIVAAGINQTKHQIDLNVTVDMELMLPWGNKSDSVITNVLVADTIIVGKVPDTYLNMQQMKGE